MAGVRLLALLFVHVALGVGWALFFFVGSDASSFPYASIEAGAPGSGAFGKSLAWICLVVGSVAWLVVVRVLARAVGEQRGRVQILGGETVVPYWTVSLVWLISATGGSLGALKLAAKAAESL
jgi:hypothetical protein